MATTDQVKAALADFDAKSGALDQAFSVDGAADQALASNAAALALAQKNVDDATAQKKQTAAAVDAALADLASSIASIQSLRNPGGVGVSTVPPPNPPAA